MHAVLSFLLLLFCVAYAALHLSLIWGWLKIPRIGRKQKSADFRTRVTVIVAARNEEKLIAQTIDAILAQDYPIGLFELIVVDDHSTDQTASIVRSYRNENMQLVQLHENNPINSYKKKAIETAISLASGKLIITTDADCVMGKKWLSSIVVSYESNDYKMISSPVAYFREQNIFEKIQALEFAYLIGLGAASIRNQTAGTCNGANLAYEKAAFLEVGGFKGIDQLASGDDELLMHKMQTKYPGKIAFLKNQAAIVYTYAKPTLSELLAQRRRWASKSTAYQAKAMVFLGIFVWLFNLSLVVNLAYAMVSGSFASFCMQILAKILIEFSFVWLVVSFFNRKGLLLLMPLLSILHIPYLIYIGIAGNAGTYQWKGRTVR